MTTGLLFLESHVGNHALLVFQVGGVHQSTSSLDLIFLLQNLLVNSLLGDEVLLCWNWGVDHHNEV